jgi:signal transduction histidine kinase
LHFKNIDLNSVNVVADKNRISQVISNLINNSIKFISTGNGNEKDANGLISITVEKAKIKSNEDIHSSDRVIEE